MFLLWNFHLNSTSIIYFVEGNTDDFGKKWNFSNPIESPDEMLPTLGDPSRDSIFAKIFGRDFFGGKS